LKFYIRPVANGVRKSRFALMLILIKPNLHKGASTLPVLVLVLVRLAMLASNVDDMTSHETSNIKI
jgi:hypothetical protein